ncbi:MAG TPA: Crp/Fnr family transcriptional regulator [Phenylobacterium sp.]|jgi:CRP-like cAMP-binding protein
MIERLLRRLARYGPPDAEERDALAAIFTPQRTFASGATMVRQFDKPRESTLLLSGLVGRVVTLKGGAQQITAVQVPGDFVDLHALLLARLDHSIVALTDCVVTSAPHAALRPVTDRYPRLGRALWYLTLVDASIHRHWLTVIGRRDAIGRAAHLLCELYVRLQDVGLAKDGAFALGLTQAEVGDVLSLSAVHVNRVVQELRARGLVSWDRRGVLIRDWDGLCALAEFESTYLQLEDQVEL